MRVNPGQVGLFYYLSWLDQLHLFFSQKSAGQFQLFLSALSSSYSN